MTTRVLVAVWMYWILAPYLQEVRVEAMSNWYACVD